MDQNLNKTILSITEKVEEIKKNDFFIITGQLNHKIGIVRKGVLRGFIMDDKGNEVNLLLYQEKDLISGNLIPGVPASINIQAIESSIIDVGEFSTAMLKLRENEYMRKVFHEMVTSLHGKIQSRLSSFVNLNSLERYQYFLKEYPNLINRIPNYYIANFLGITPTQLSRIRKTFAYK